MIDRDLIVTLLEKEEGYRRFVYDDATGETIRPATLVRGFPTVGIGRNLLHRGISPEEARYLLANDVDEFVEWCRDNLDYFRSLCAVRAAVIVSMAFQLGPAGVKAFQRMHAAIRAKDWDEAALQMLDSKWARQTPNRAQRAATMMRTGEWTQ